MKKNYKTFALLSYSIGIVLWFGDFGALVPSLSRLIGLISFALLAFASPYWVFVVFDWKVKTFSVLLKVGSLLHVLGVILFGGTMVWLKVSHPGFSALGPGLLGEALIFIGLTLMIVTMMSKK